MSIEFKFEFEIGLILESLLHNIEGKKHTFIGLLVI